MYEYLIKKLSNLSFSRTFELQSNLFEIVEASSGTVLDTTCDLDFLTYLLESESSFSINGNNQFLLSGSEVFAYTVRRMYYYNPQMLDSLIIGNFNVQRWFDVNDPRVTLLLNDDCDITRLKSKDATNMYGNYISPVAIGYEVSMAPYQISNYIFWCMYNDYEGKSWTIPGAATLAPLNFNQPFSVAGVVKCSSCEVCKWIYTKIDTGFSTYIRFGISVNGTVLSLHAEFHDNDGHNQVVTKTFTVDPADVVRFIISSDGSIVDFYINDETKQSYSLISLTARNIIRGFLFDYDENEFGFTGRIFELIIVADYCSDQQVSLFKSYFKTKYYLS